jgi:hypothetical protein
LYIELAKRVFHGHLNLHEWDTEAAWRGFTTSLGEFVLNLPEWREYLSALKNRDEREALSAAGAGPEEPAKLTPNGDEFPAHVLDNAWPGPEVALRAGLLAITKGCALEIPRNGSLELRGVLG